MTIYEELIERVSNGEAFHIDFEKRIMKIGKQKIIDDGRFDETRKLINIEWNPGKGVILQIIENLYHNYKYSLPSERSDSKRRKYFKTLPIDEISDEQLMTAERREVSQAKLEGFILCTVLNGVFKWNDEMGKWFYQSQGDPDLVILRNWIENK